MKPIHHIKTSILILLAFLLGVQAIRTKAEIILLLLDIPKLWGLRNNDNYFLVSLWCFRWFKKIKNEEWKIKNSQEV